MYSFCSGDFFIVEFFVNIKLLTDVNSAINLQRKLRLPHPLYKYETLKRPITIFNLNQ